MSDRWAEWLARGRFAGMTDAEREQALRGLEETRDRVLDGALLAPGDDVLDLGSGTGLLAFEAHEQVGVGWVYAVDPEVEALEELLRAAHDLDVPGIAYLVGDAKALPLPDASVDAVVARSVLMDVDDLDEAAREIERVLRPGGRVSLYEPIGRKGSYIETTVDWTPLGDELAARVRDEWETHAASSRPMRVDDERLAAALRGAGLADVSVELEAREERWPVDERSVEARLDAGGVAGEPSLRARWLAAFAAEEVERLVAHLEALAGTTIAFRRVAAWVTARKR